MLSQIQPHFIYNVLAVIQELCHDKAPEAEEVTVSFAQFLRVNMDSLTLKHAIPFSKELEHTKNYLALEQKRFGKDMLNVEYDIQAENFNIPSLTLQPIVENAVKYGIMKKVEGGTVRIRTYETDTDFVIDVTDDGRGFSPDSVKDDGRSHIGINNVRERLQDMCCGTLNITSIPDKGTKAVITVPRI